MHLKKFEQKAKKLVAQVQDDPYARYQLRVKFYDIYGYTLLPHQEGFGNAELDFLQWEINRGVLNPLNDPDQPGSPWWRAVNSHFLYVSELAGMLKQAKFTDQSVSLAVRFWLDYMDHPTPQSWYKAHNKSIVDGYLNHTHEAKKENSFERHFMNEVLYRLLYAQALVEGEEFGELGQILANPKLPSVDIIVHLPEFYPNEYPLKKDNLWNILHQGYLLEEFAEIILDNWLILPQLEALYQWSAHILQTPEINHLVVDGKAVYPEIQKP